ncbi:MAG: hypothetical protein ABIK43_07270 [candidate division WOR-3 bacterium]
MGLSGWAVHPGSSGVIPQMLWEVLREMPSGSLFRVQTGARWQVQSKTPGAVPKQSLSLVQMGLPAAMPIVTLRNVLMAVR